MVMRSKAVIRPIVDRVLSPFYTSQRQEHDALATQVANYC
jgi:hypothetical protein